MSTAEFESLSKSDKARAINTYGVFISERRLGIDRIYLFALNSFYVELFHNLTSPDNAELTVHRVFTEPDYLDVYLENVDAASLIGEG
jgi:hypothetical protein